MTLPARICVVAIAVACWLMARFAYDFDQWWLDYALFFFAVAAVTAPAWWSA